MDLAWGQSPLPVGILVVAPQLILCVESSFTLWMASSEAGVHLPQPHQGGFPIKQIFQATSIDLCAKSESPDREAEG